MSISGRGRINRDVVLDRTCFMLWVELGSLAKVAKNLKNRGIVGKTGKPLATLSIRARAMNWVVYNADEARKYYLDDGLIEAEHDDEWELWILSTAMDTFKYQKKMFLEWARRTGYDKYKDEYAEYFSIKDQYYREIFVSDGSQDLEEIAENLSQYFKYEDGQLYLKVHGKTVNTRSPMYS